MTVTEFASKIRGFLNLHGITPETLHTMSPSLRAEYDALVNEFVTVIDEE